MRKKWVFWALQDIQFLSLWNLSKSALFAFNCHSTSVFWFYVRYSVVRSRRRSTATLSNEFINNFNIGFVILLLANGSDFWVRSQLACRYNALNFTSINVASKCITITIISKETSKCTLRIPGGSVCLIKLRLWYREVQIGLRGYCTISACTARIFCYKCETPRIFRMDVSGKKALNKIIIAKFIYTGRKLDDKKFHRQWGVQRIPATSFGKILLISCKALAKIGNISLGPLFSRTSTP